MYVKSLTLRGFKSFASATTLQFTPGIICVVGPNGSGKSNIVDALAWVMGEQGAKNLRGGSMADVIFAGTSSRASLGRAEVALTIDNTNGELPIDYSEVTISRTLFRQGGSEYAINGTPCRLLDIQELLSDTGMGRNMHVIIGQGKLDQVLSANPSQRRALIEEAAGVLKHQRRKERALRKLEGLEDKLSRLSDLTQEIQKQLGPLARQAKTARRAAVLQAQARDAGCRILADDLQQLRLQLARYQESEQTLSLRREELAAQLTKQREKLEKLNADAQQGDLAGRAANLWQQLTTLTERLRALGALAGERAASLSKPEPVPSGPSVAERQKHLARLQSELAAKDEEALARRKQCDAAQAAREESTRKVGELTRQAQELREEVQQKTQKSARLERELETAKARLEAARSRLKRAENSAETAREKLSVARAEQAAHQEETVEAGTDAATRYRELSEVENEARSQLEKARDQLRESEAKAVAAAESETSLRQVLAASSNQAQNAFTQAAQPDGELASLISVSDRWEKAIAALLGSSGAALVVEASQVDAGLGAVKDNTGIVSWVVSEGVQEQRIPLGEVQITEKEGVLPAAAAVQAPRALHTVLIALLDKSYLAPDLAAARALVAKIPQARVGVVDGTVISKYLGSTGSGGVNRIQVERQLRLARQAAVQAQEQTQKARSQVETNTQELSQAAAASAQALKTLRAADAQAAAQAQKRALREAAVQGAESEAQRAASEVAQAQKDVDSCSQQVTAADKAYSEFAGSEDLAPLQAAEQALEQARATDLAAREKEAETHLALAAATQITTNLRCRFQGEVKSLERFQLRLAASKQREIKHAQDAQRMLQVASWCEVFARQGAQVAQVAKTWRESADAAREASSQAAQQLRKEIDRLNKELAELNDLSRRDEVAAAEYRVRAEQLTQQAQERYALSEEELIASFGPQQLAPDPDLLARKAANAQEVATTASQAEESDRGEKEGEEGPASTRSRWRQKLTAMKLLQSKKKDSGVPMIGSNRARC
ncbi:AAA family ATPase [Varibaculum cambriense]|nr:AAA family ATPase [Varibaculum cambriense]